MVSRRNLFLFALALTPSILFLTLTILRERTIVDAYGLAWGAAICFFGVIPYGIVVLFAYAIAYIIRKNPFRYLIIFPILLISTFWVSVIVARSLASSHGAFYRYHNQLESVIEQIEQGNIQSNIESTGYTNAKLPALYQHLSINGEVKIYRNEEETAVLFYRSSGILGEFTGYAYYSGTNFAILDTELWCDQTQSLDKYHWHYCISH